MARTKEELYEIISDLAELTPAADVDRLVEFWWSDPTPGACARLERFIRAHLPTA
jgi:hypothetical protein